MDKKPCDNKLASALEDYFTRYIAGRQDTGGEWPVTFNTTTEVVEQLETMISESEAAKKNGLNTWYEVWSPYNTKAFFVVAEPPKVLPMPSFEQNALQTIQLTFTINDYKGQDTGIEPGE